MQSVIKFQAPFERLKEYVPSPEIRLCKSIITQAIVDASNTSDCSKAKAREKEAKEWIFGNGDHFQTICYFADNEPGFVVKIAKEVIKLNLEKFELKNKNSKRTSVNLNKAQPAKKATM